MLCIAAAMLWVIPLAAEEQPPQQCISKTALPVYTSINAPSKNAHITKWCRSDGTVRYTNLDISPDGYTPCGELETIAVCDPLGNKFFGQASQVPYAYRDCALGKRIYLEKNGQAVNVKAALQQRRQSDLANLSTNATEKKKERESASAPNSAPGLPDFLNSDYMNIIQSVLGDETLDSLPLDLRPFDMSGS